MFICNAIICCMCVRQFGHQPKLIKFSETAHPSVVSKCHDYFSRNLKELCQQKGTFHKQASTLSYAFLASNKVAHRIAKCKEPHTIAEELILPAAVDMVNLMIGESAGVSAFALMKSKYRSKINVEKEISSLIPRFENMCGDQQAHPSHKQIL